ncbi:hypothetical protein PVAP13_6KG071100 [Panicum virgatum]|uniref:Uncharacterized protein n=1 Tax=Panicum virgatum TaxID=38727 RepID=A0A8T0R9V6_PANVG|nr:hypothetical protein PVAP13_6KG071100 [Panicum virgatum]
MEMEVASIPASLFDSRGGVERASAERNVGPSHLWAQIAVPANSPRRWLRAHFSAVARTIGSAASPALPWHARLWISVRRTQSPTPAPPPLPLGSGSPCIARNLQPPAPPPHPSASPPVPSPAPISSAPLVLSFSGAIRSNRHHT